MIEIINYIPKGKDNAITRHELVMKTGLPDRDVRSLIAEARYETPIISTGKGYYQPTSWKEVER